MPPMAPSFLQFSKQSSKVHLDEDPVPGVLMVMCTSRSSRSRRLLSVHFKDLRSSGVLGVLAFRHAGVLGCCCTCSGDHRRPCQHFTERKHFGSRICVECRVLGFVSGREWMIRFLESKDGMLSYILLCLAQCRLLGISMTRAHVCNGDAQLLPLQRGAKMAYRLEGVGMPIFARSPATKMQRSTR